MNKREAAIVTAYTGMVCGEFSDAHEYIEEVMGGPVMTHMLGNKEYVDKVKEAAKNDFIALSSSLTD